MDADAAPRTVELMRTLDEKYIANALTFAESTMTATLTVDAAPLRLADGTVDRDLITAIIEQATWRMPALRARLRNTPLALTAPAWVFMDDFALDRHVRFAGVETDGSMAGAALAGRSNGALVLDEPMWSAVVFELGSETDDLLAVVLRAHHAVGDGMYGIRVLNVLTDAEPFIPEPDAHRIELPRAPRWGVGLWVHAGAQWLAEFPLLAPAWREYWRKPFSKRLRRWGGRILRPLRLKRADPAAFPSHLARRRYAVANVSLPHVKQVARQYASSVSHYVVASTLVALAAATPTPDEVALLVPISRRAGRADDTRNHVFMTRVAIRADAPIAEATVSVREQMDRAVESGSGDLTGPTPGYVTHLPWSTRPRYFGPAEVRSTLAWPVITPYDSVAVLTTTYRDNLGVTLIANEDIDIDAALASIVANLSAELSSASEVSSSSGVTDVTEAVS